MGDIPLVREDGGKPVNRGEAAHRPRSARRAPARSAGRGPAPGAKRHRVDSRRADGRDRPGRDRAAPGSRPRRRTLAAPRGRQPGCVRHPGGSRSTPREPPSGSKARACGPNPHSDQSRPPDRVRGVPCGYQGSLRAALPPEHFEGRQRRRRPARTHPRPGPQGGRRGRAEREGRLGFPTPEPRRPRPDDSAPKRQYVVSFEETENVK